MYRIKETINGKFMWFTVQRKIFGIWTTVRLGEQGDTFDTLKDAEEYIEQRTSNKTCRYHYIK